MKKTNRKAKPAQPAPRALKYRTQSLAGYLSAWVTTKGGGGFFDTRRLERSDIPVAVIPTATAKQAKALAAFCNLSREERVERAAKATFQMDYPDRLWSKWQDGATADNYRQFVRAIHALIFGGAK